MYAPREKLKLPIKKTPNKHVNLLYVYGEINKFNLTFFCPFVFLATSGKYRTDTDRSASMQGECCQKYSRCSILWRIFQLFFSSFSFQNQAWKDEHAHSPRMAAQCSSSQTGSIFYLKLKSSFFFSGPKITRLTDRQTDPQECE